MNRLLKLLKKYNNVIVFLILEIIAFILLSNSNAYQRSKFFNFNREITGAIYDFSDGTKEYLHLRQSNEALLEENTRLRNELERLEALPLSQPLIIDSSDYEYIAAKIVHLTKHKQFNYITIDRGWKDSIHADMALIGPKGVAGIVLESSANYATAIPIINLDFRASVKTLPGNYAGILQWDGTSTQTAELHEIPYHAEISIGDSIVTSGFSSIFPEGLFVGTISNFSMKEGNFFDIDIDLGTDYSNLFQVNVIKNHHQKEQLNLEEELEK